ncbi:probable ATP-dependent RNA helicase DDX31 [Chanos chanos]|uniref:ATP-dependent RNA helicase n=1 Tax=Chanos chanos TaxID=29144 RepID=A0A6J2WTR0_CHACN|nr:probable ATP-dependent RNA helicase DDX31 [Chanos chanos]
MAEDMLMLNISTNPITPTFNSLNRPHKSLSGREKWAKKKDTAKRKAVFATQEGTPTKQKKFNHSGPDNQSSEQSPKSQRAQTSPLKSGHKPSGDSGDETEKPVTKSSAKTKTFSKKHTEEQRGQERPFIKTSSLFRNNPDIPDVQSPAVTKVKEKVFTGNSFEELDLHPHLVSTLNKVLNISSMTSVQKKTIPVLLSGRDAVVRSQTGSGKTLAYGIPLVQSLQAVQPKIKRSDGPLAVIVVPTRELAQQSFQIFQKLLKPFTWIVPGVLMGGEKRKAEKARLRKGINILISTPGRLVDHIKNTLSIAFSAVRWLILDEADRILDLGFEKDLTVILNALNNDGPARQNVLLSATLTEGLSRLAAISMKDPVSIQVSENSEEPEETVESTPQTANQSLTSSYAVPEGLHQHVVVVPSKLRLVCLSAFILARCKFEKGQKLIVFVSSCEAVEFLFTLFNAVLLDKKDDQAPPQHHPSLNFLKLHGNMKQEERTEVFQEFSQCKSGILLCTDVAARGLDLPQVTWIVQYNPPISAEEYVHRVGRTARIGTTGSSLLFLTPSETSYIDVLASHNISLAEMKMQSILATLMQDPRFKGRGKWNNKKSSGPSEQEVRERATVLQTEFENFVHANQEAVQSAKKALQSFLRAYTTYPSSMKHIFHIRGLHLGHTAKSFGLRDAPGGLASATATANPRAGKKDKNKAKDKEKRPPKKQSSKQREASLMLSEYASGLRQGLKSKKKKKKNRQTNAEDQERTEG